MDSTMTTPIVSRAELLRPRFLAKVAHEPTSGCWLWTGSVSLWGYGQFAVGRRTASAHRVAWEIFRGLIPDGYEVDHLCRTKICVNPDHLEPVTHAENIRRGGQLLKATAYWTSKTHCPQGHAYSERNLYVTRTGWRQCKACNAARERRRQARLRATTS